jgi:4-carboxymuconolactone decarboxylase
MEPTEEGRARLAEVHDERSLATIEGLGPVGGNVIGYVYGDVFGRPGMSLRDRELVAVAVLATLDRQSQLRQHLRAALKAGVTAEELEELVLEVAVLAGFPLALSAQAMLQAVLTE